MSLHKLNNINKDLEKTTETLHDSLHNLLNRGEKLDELIKKSNDLQDISSLFKKSTYKLVNKLLQDTSKKQDDYKTENEETNIVEYETHLKKLLREGEIQYVFDKAAQLGLINFIKYIINITKIHPVNLYINQALISASFLGHFYIVELVLDHDIDNEKFYGRKPREASQSFFYPLIDEPVSKIPFSNLPLTQDDLKNAIVQSILANHIDVQKLLEQYYFRTFDIKERYNENPPKPHNFEPIINLKEQLENDRLLF